MTKENIAAIADEIHKASARALSVGIAHGGQGYSLTIGQVTEILTRHLTDEGSCEHGETAQALITMDEITIEQLAKHYAIRQKLPAVTIELREALVSYKAAKD